MIEQDADSELEYRIRSIQPRKKRSIVQICRLELLKSNRGTPRNINVMLRSERNHFMPLDTGSPGCFLNKQTADILLRHNPQFFGVQNLPNEFSYEDYNTDSIKVFGSLSIPISSGGWRKFITPFSWCRRLELGFHSLLGMELQRSLGIHAIQRSLFTRLGRSKSHQVRTNLMDPLIPRQIKGRKMPIHIQVLIHREDAQASSVRGIKGAV